MIIASCSSESGSSAYSSVPVGENLSVGYNNNDMTNTVNNVVFQANDQMESTEKNIQREDQAYYVDSKKYIVMSGDTVYRIAVNMLGDGSRWVEIAQLNKLESLSNGSVLIHPGQELILP